MELEPILSTNVKNDAFLLTKKFNTQHASPHKEDKMNSLLQETFITRHIGPSSEDIAVMLKELGFTDLESFIAQVIPMSLRSQEAVDVPSLLKNSFTDEKEALSTLKNLMSQNKISHSLMGMGFYDSFTPPVILRNLFENPGWYTAYTPYQAEISQGRMESLLNFQTLVAELTGMDLAGASMLDEGTSAAEAMSMCLAHCKNKEAKSFFVSADIHPPTLEVIKTRALPLGIDVVVKPAADFPWETQTAFGCLLQYPGTDGHLQNLQPITQKAHAQGALVVVAAELLSLCVLTPPGEWGADIVIGNSQRFGVPMGMGGPHAAFLATRDAFKRLMPGRIIGVSIDADKKAALRLALQTREQHIKRERATSNICTAQALLANMAAMYAVYHGPTGLNRIAYRIHVLTCFVYDELLKMGLTPQYKSFFDTLLLALVSKEERDRVWKKAEGLGLLLRKKDQQLLAITLNETTELSHIAALLSSFALGTEQITEQAAQERWHAFLKRGENKIPTEFKRTSSYLKHPNFNRYHSETELMRYMKQLENKDIALNFSMIPLGSCTMKLNAASELLPVSWPEINSIHPYAPPEHTKGYQEFFRDMEQKLCAVTGFSAVSLQPNAGSQGEYLGLLVIREYFKARGEDQRKICLIPSSAHGTNPASAVMAGFQVVVVNCDANGNVDLSDLKAKAELHRDSLAALMITYPSTHGVFEEGIREICQRVHENGGQVYMDGANLNALVGLCRPRELGADVCHMNLHKTFAIPHGGGGPGVGPIGVAEHLKSFLPDCANMTLGQNEGASLGKNRVGSSTSAPYGSASILPISWLYMELMGSRGLKLASEVAILSANYIAKRLEPHFKVLFKGNSGLVAHECIIDLRDLKKSAQLDVNDVAKRLMDYGFHAPTMSWPVAGTLMIEPTESEPLSELDRFIEAMIQIKKEIDKVAAQEWPPEDNPLVNAPHTAEMLLADEWNHPYSRIEAAYPLPWLKDKKYWPPVRRVDNAFGDRNLVCTCPDIQTYNN